MNLKSTIILAIAFAALGIGCGKANKRTENESQLTPPTEALAQVQPLPEGAIPFDYAGHLYFDVIVRDTVPAKMIFDTGNTSILIDTQFFKEHFAPSPTLQRTLIQGTGNSLEAAYRDTSDWIYSVGEYSTTEQGATVLDLRKILGYHVDGMFGMEFMRGRKVEFNYADGYMLILPQEAQPAEGYTCVKCKWLDGRQARMVMPISVKINDAISFDGNFLVDMGSSGSVSLNSSLVAKLKLNRVLTDVKKKLYDTGGVGGSRTDYIFKADRVSVAGNDIPDMRLDYSGNTQGMMAEDRFDGLVGNEFLERFDVIIDFAKCEIWLRPNRNFSTARAFDSGMTLTPQVDGWIVNGLTEGSNAHRAGVRRGDLITSINRLTPDKVDIKRLKAMGYSAEDWTVTIKRTTTEEITFKKDKY
ncbi:MAG: aspartyl protease family protein [Alistipes sp.]|nr:aspartyl protease family protein [Alistipes sp.]